MTLLRLILCVFVIGTMVPIFEAHAVSTCEVRTGIPTYPDGREAPQTCDIHGSPNQTIVDGTGTSVMDNTNGAVGVTMKTLLSGEDPTATGANTSGVMAVEFRYLSSGSKTSDFQVKASAGFVHNMVCLGTDTSATGGSIAVENSLTAGGTSLFTFTVVNTNNYSTQPLVFPIDAVFSTGIFLDFTTTADVSCTVTYR